MTSHTASNMQAYTPVMSMLQKAVQRTHCTSCNQPAHTNVIMVYAVKCSLYVVGPFCQSKIGRRRPISLDDHCVNISQWIFINKISLERSFHYLNVDTLFLKIEQEMTPLRPFEVTQLNDVALDRSTSVTCGRDFAHSITMVT